MPVIPERGGPRQLQDTNLGRVTATELPGIQEATTLGQVDRLVQSGVKLGKVLEARKEKKDRENNDLLINERFLAFQAASLQKENEYNQIPARDSQGMFQNWKQDQDSIWQNATQGLTEEQRKLFDQRAAGYGTQVNARIATRESALHKQRIQENYQASATAANLNAYKELARPSLFYENINEARRLNSELLKSQGVNETEINNKDQIYFSKAVKDAIIMTSALSAPRAEAWYEKALKDEELTTNDSLLVRNALDKRKGANDEEALLGWAQTQADKLFSNYGENREAIFQEIEKQTSGSGEAALKKEVNLRFTQITAQNAENQRAFLRTGKGIIDNAANATEARKQVTSIMADPNATIDTANKLEGYINDVFEKPAGKKVTNPSKLDEVYTMINKTLAGTAKPEDIINSAEDIAVKFGPYLSIADTKAAQDYLRNNGLFGRTAYNDLLQSFANMKQRTLAEVRDSEKDLAEFKAYLDYARPLLPPDKAVSPFDLQKISAEFFIAGERAGETPRLDTEFLSIFDAEENETYQEAARRGRGLAWTPDLDGEQARIATSLIAEENAIRIKNLQRPIQNNPRNRALIYKQRVMLLPSVESE